MKKYIYFLLIGTMLLISELGFAQSSVSVTKHIAGKTYRLNELVSRNGVIYRALLQNSSTPPSTDWVNISTTAGSGAGNINDGSVVGSIAIWNGTSWVETNFVNVDGTGDFNLTEDLIVVGSITGSNISGTNTGDQIAGTVPFTPAGNISSTNVQDAIEELESEVSVVETDPVFTAEEGDILKTNEPKAVTSTITYNTIPLVNATSAEIDGVGDLSAVNRRWAVEFLQGGGAEVDPVYTANLPNLVQTTGDQTVNGQKTFATPPILNNNPTLDSQIGNRLYNDGRYTRFDQSAIISANWTFQNPISGVDGVDPTDLVTKQQLDNATPTESDPIYASDSSRIAKTDLDTDFANGLRASGQDQFAWSGDLVANLQYLYDNYQSITEGGFAGEDLTGGQIVYQGANDQWFKADADVLAHVRGRLAFVTQGGTAGSWLPFTTIITVGGSGFTAGAPLYLSNTAGGYTETLPTTGYVRVIGASTSTTTRKIITEPINWINADGSEVNGVPVAGGGGGGDMTKAVYDTDSDNVVDDAEALNGFTDYPRLSTANTFTQDQTVQGTMDADYYNILTDRFIHNYWGNSENTAPNDWAGNTFVGLNSGT